MSSRRPCSVSHASVILTVLFLVFITSSEAQLSPSFYSRTCPNALPTIRSVVRSAVQAERRMAASLIRLHFHDCFVQGCDASLLLEDAPNISSERNVIQNKDSARGFNIIERAKSQVERICPGVVSCADILTLAAQYSSEAIAGPTWPVKLGRRDSRSAFPALAARDLPSFTDSLESLISQFGRKGLSARDMVALSGSHTIGQAQCATFRDRIYNNASSIDAGFARTRQRRCPADGGGRNLAPLDLVTPNSWDNNYFRNLIQRKGLLESDQVLFSGGSTDSIVREYIKSPATFNSDFAAAMVKMADIEPLTGSSGEIRRICSAIN